MFPFHKNIRGSVPARPTPPVIRVALLHKSTTFWKQWTNLFVWLELFGENAEDILLSKHVSEDLLKFENNQNNIEPTSQGLFLI